MPLRVLALSSLSMIYQYILFGIGLLKAILEICDFSITFSNFFAYDLELLYMTFTGGNDLFVDLGLGLGVILYYVIIENDLFL